MRSYPGRATPRPICRAINQQSHLLGCVSAPVVRHEVQNAHLFGRPNSSSLDSLVAFVERFCCFKAHRAIWRTRTGSSRHIHDLENSSGASACLVNWVRWPLMAVTLLRILSSFPRPTRHARTAGQVACHRQSHSWRTRPHHAFRRITRLGQQPQTNIYDLYLILPMVPSHITPTIALLLCLQTATASPSLSDLSPWIPWVRRSTNSQTNKLQRRANQTVWISSEVYHGETFFE